MGDKLNSPRILCQQCMSRAGSGVYASTHDLTILREQLADTRAELSNVLHDWNAIVAASGSPTNGGAVGYVATLRADVSKLQSENERLREALEMIRHATAPTPDDGGYHEAAYDLANSALEQLK